MVDWLRADQRYLIVAEKPSQLTFLKNLFGRLKNVELIALRGHCLELCDLAEYDPAYGVSWLELVKHEIVPFIPDEFRKTIKKDKPAAGKKQSSKAKFGQPPSEILKKLALAAKKSDQIILACDPDNEGMALGVEALEWVRQAGKIVGAINMSRLDAQSLRESIKTIHNIPWREMAAAGSSRAQYDWALGINCTIAATVFLGNGETLHVGGVKIPTLKMVVDREQQIQNHKVETYYTLHGTARHETSGQEFEFDVKIDRHTELSQRTGKAIEQHLRKNPICEVTDYMEKFGVTQAPPKPFSLANLQHAASTRLNMSPTRCQALAQQLYESGHLSYPRTDSQYYARGQMAEVDKILGSLLQLSPYNRQSITLPAKASSMIFVDEKITAHAAISPTSLLPESDWIQELSWLWHLVATRYVIQFMERYTYNCFALLCSSRGSEKLNKVDIQLFSSENVTTELGWRKLQGWGGETAEFKAERSIPRAKVGDKVRVLTIEMRQHQTRPPARFTEATLIKAMERVAEFVPELSKDSLAQGIGTPATRAKLVDNLIREGYLAKTNLLLNPTEKGTRLISLLPADISNVGLRADLENKISEISLGNLHPNLFQTEFKALVEQCYEQIKEVGRKLNLKPSVKNYHPRPTQKQMKYATNLAKRLKIEIPPAALDSAPEMSFWIGVAVEKCNQLPATVKTTASMFSEKQKRLVIDNCEDPHILGLLDSQDRSDYKLVSQWIGKFLSQRKKTKNQIDNEIIVELAEDSE